MSSSTRNLDVNILFIHSSCQPWQVCIAIFAIYHVQTLVLNLYLEPVK